MKDDGIKGDGTTKGTCYNSNDKCQADGTCSVCASRTELPHTGCEELNPICNGGSTCVCNPGSPEVICDPSTSSLCSGANKDSPYAGGTCKCGLMASGGTDNVCTSNNNGLSKCVTGSDSTSHTATCQVVC